MRQVGRLPDEERLEIGKLIVDRFFTETMQKEEATAWLKSMGFERVEWVMNEEGDILLCLLWRFNPIDSTRLLDEFIIEFAGHDSLVVTLFNPVKEVVM